MKGGNIGNMLGWSAIDQFFRVGFQFLVVIVLARILTPTDFGIYAMLAVFVALANTLASAGIADALIQRKLVTHQEESTLFFVSVVFALLVAMLMCAAAHWIANFYRQPILESISYVMALCVFVGALGSVQMALFSRQLNFKTTALIGGFAAALSGVVAVLAALSGWGVWSLVAQTLVSTIASTFLLWFKHPWRPSWIFNITAVSPLLRFGGSLLASRLLNIISVNVYSLVIGKLFSAQDVGFFNRASNFQNLLVSSMSGVVAKVAFPVFSSVGGNRGKLERGLGKALLGTVFFSAPLAVLVVLLAQEIVLILFGAKWAESIPLLQVLGLEILIWPIHLMNVNLLMAMGFGGLMFKGVIVKLFITAAMLFIAAPYGVIGIAIGAVASSYINLLVNILFTKHVIDFGFIKQLKAIMPCLVSVIPMILLILSADEFLMLHGALKVLFACVLGGGVYLVMTFLVGVYRFDQIKEILFR